MLTKVCGVTRAAELDALAMAGAQFAGLWHGVPGGHAELTLEQCSRLSAAARERPGVEPVLVTLLADAGALERSVRAADVGWAQLHGYQAPAVVGALKRGLGGRVRIIKALHLSGRACLEAPLVRAYERAGVDVFLFDTVTDDGRVGSTGRAADSEALDLTAERLRRPFLLAGGISAGNAGVHQRTTARIGCVGIDIDTHARGPDGTLDRGRIDAVRRAWAAAWNDGAQR